MSFPPDAVYGLAESWGAPREELESIRQELIAAKERYEGAGSSVWAYEVVALWAAREAARASGRAPRPLGPKPPPRPPIAITCNVAVAERYEDFAHCPAFRCGRILGHSGNHKPPRPV